MFYSTLKFTKYYQLPCLHAFINFNFSASIHAQLEPNYCNAHTTKQL